MDDRIKFIIGIDGGGTGTRVLIARPGEMTPFAAANGEPSALNQGVEKAWRAIMTAIAQAFSGHQMPVPMLSECALGIGLSGANNLVWKNEFYLRNPGFRKMLVDTDGYTTLMGAHGGQAGAIVAVGTGSVGMVLDKTGQRRSVSGWGFPSGDEASGSWLGLKAVELTQKAFDGRRSTSPLSEAVKSHCGTSPEDFLQWLGEAGPHAFARLTPLIFANATQDPAAADLLTRAGVEIAEMVEALDFTNELPLSICGRLGEALIPYLPESTRQRHRTPQGDSASGALHLISQSIS